MTLNEHVEHRLYDRLESFDGFELNEQNPVGGSIASVLSEGEVLADDGEQYTSIQDAVDASNSWTFIGPGTYYENVVIDNDDFTLKGAGENTIIDCGSETGLTVNGNNGHISHITIFKTGPSDTNRGVVIQGTNCSIANCKFEYEFGGGIETGTNTLIASCRFNRNGDSSSFDDAIGFNEPNSIIINNITNETFAGNGNRAIVANNISKNAFGNGIYFADANDSIAIGNRVINSRGRGISTEANDTIVANNRVSNSAVDDITNNGTNTTLDGNLTGSAN